MFERRIASGESLPERDAWMLDRPVIGADYAPYWGAFQFLRDERSMSAGGMGPPFMGAIPLEAIRAYLDEAFVFDPLLRWRFVLIVRALDGEERRLISAMVNKEIKGAPQSQRKGKSQTLQEISRG